MAFQVDRLGPGCFRLAGELDMASTPILDLAMLAAVEGRGDVVLDLAELTFIDSYGIGSLVALSQALDHQARKLVLAAPTTFILGVLRIAGVEFWPGVQVRGPSPGPGQDG